MPTLALCRFRRPITKIQETYDAQHSSGPGPDPGRVSGRGRPGGECDDIVVATVNNGHMIEMQKLTKFFEQANPDIHVKWVTLEEGVLRQRATTDIATQGGQFDVMTIGMLETPIWGKKGWLQEIKPDAAYDVDDLLPAIRNGLSSGGKLYAAPFYGESSMLMYRKDLADKAGVKFADRPTWDQVRDAAAKMNDPKNGVYGICLRGKPGWATTWPFSRPWSTPSAASGSTCRGSRSWKASRA